MIKWTEQQKNFVYFIALVTLVVGYSASSIDSMDGSPRKYLSAALLVIGYWMAVNNLGAKYGYRERLPSLGGGFAWFIASVCISYSVDLHPLIESWITVGMTAPFFFHFVHASRKRTSK